LIIGLAILVVAGYIVASAISLLFFPIESDEPPPETVTVTRTVTLPPP
jgi:hypothetical protein